MRGPKTVSAWAVREKGKDSKVTQEERQGLEEFLINCSNMSIPFKSILYQKEISTNP